SNLVVNGDFEQDIFGGGFDWHYVERPQVSITQETGVAYQGTRSLAVSFAGDNIQEFGLNQYVPVKPNSRYRLQAYVKADNIVGASGPRLTVVDVYNGWSPLYTSDDML